MRYLAWVIMAAVFLVTFLLTQDLIMSFAAELVAVFVMMLFGKQFFFGDTTNADQAEKKE
ncbi:exported hypothetical protein [Candidatus Terasakiella magnetica]|uniref:Uncharacterized protein n=1 Tax=Candidatus Terasakiella magnetica TaxID=1867952 RepID=A0A1C3RKI2_9PROT|nr:hypothetical protein [Candidatus Terasakiella magnetica]SCA57755.1 exported hypothetical protein [Candidatus Terasakiella magnetica]